MALHVMHRFSSSLSARGLEGEGRKGGVGRRMELLDPEGSDGCTPPHSHSETLGIGGPVSSL